MRVALLGVRTVQGRITVALRMVFLGRFAIPVNQHDLGQKIYKQRERQIETLME